MQQQEHRVDIMEHQVANILDYTYHVQFWQHNSQMAVTNWSKFGGGLSRQWGVWKQCEYVKTSEKATEERYGMSVIPPG